MVQDRDWSALPLEAREKVRETQRKYVEVWVRQLRAIQPDLRAEGRPGPASTRPSACSTPPRTARFLPPEEMRALLSSMAVRALGVNEVAVSVAVR